MLVTLANFKTYAGISGTTYDTFLTEQITVISDAIEGYCNRVFAQTVWKQTYYSKDYKRPVGDLTLWQFPVASVTSIIQDGTTIDSATYRIHKPTGIVTRDDGFLYGEVTEVIYTAGFATMPSPVTNAVYELVNERYNKKVSGVQLNFGSDVQRISIPGAISIDFDYTLNNNERKNAFGQLLGSQVNVLDYYRSERAFDSGHGKLEYAEVNV